MRLEQWGLQERLRTAEKSEDSSFIRLTDYKKEELQEIFDIADNIDSYEGFLNGRTVVMFFPASSIRTRVSFEKGIHLLGGQTILFDPSTLDKKEDIRDVCGYLENWADAVIVRHKDIEKLAQMSANLDVPVINAMTDDNHPCEMMSDFPKTPDSDLLEEIIKAR